MGVMVEGLEQIIWLEILMILCISYLVKVFIVHWIRGLAGLRQLVILILVMGMVVLLLLLVRTEPYLLLMEVEMFLLLGIWLQIGVCFLILMNLGVPILKELL